jgi:hypothetical protein
MELTRFRGKPTILLREDVSLPTVAARLGHSTTMCAKTYAHQIEGDDRAAMVKFGASVAKSGMRLPGASALAPEKPLNVLTEKAA